MDTQSGRATVQATYDASAPLISSIIDASTGATPPPFASATTSAHPSTSAR